MPLAPGPLIVVSSAPPLVGVFSLDRRGHRGRRRRAGRAAGAGLAGRAASDLATLLLPAVGIAIVAFTDNVLTGRAFAAPQASPSTPNAGVQRARRAANIARRLPQGFPVSSSGSRTALGDAMGSRTQLYSLVTLASWC